MRKLLRGISNNCDKRNFMDLMNPFFLRNWNICSRASHKSLTYSFNL